MRYAEERIEPPNAPNNSKTFYFFLHAILNCHCEAINTGDRIQLQHTVFKYIVAFEQKRQHETREQKINERMNY